MIRIVDLFNKPGEDNSKKDELQLAPLIKESQPLIKESEPLIKESEPLIKESEPPVKLTADELKKTLDTLAGSAKFFVNQKKLSPEAAQQETLLITALGTLVDQQTAGNPELAAVLEQWQDEPAYRHALEKISRAVQIGLDANFKSAQLNQIALLALLRGLEAGQTGRAGILVVLVGRRVRLDNEKFNNVLNLADIYEQIVHSGL